MPETYRRAGGSIPRKAINVSPQMHSALKSYAQKNNISLTEAVFRLLSLALDKEGWPEDTGEAAPLP